MNPWCVCERKIECMSVHYNFCRCVSWLNKLWLNIKAEIAILTHWVKISHSEWEWNGWLLLLLVECSFAYSRGLARGAPEREVRKAQENCSSFPAKWRTPTTTTVDSSLLTQQTNTSAKCGERRKESFFHWKFTSAARFASTKKENFLIGLTKEERKFLNENIYIREKRECWRMSRSDVMLRV